MAGQTASTSRSFALYADGTDIDRESCDRVVPMKVLALGLCRTGTLSFRSALKGLGYIDTYHMRSASTETPRDNEMWMRAIEAKFDGKGHFGKAGWDKLLGHCQAVCDFPAAAFGPELIAAYPDAKVILTLRDADSWQLSTAKTVWKVIQDPTFRSLTFFNPTLRKYRLMLSTLLDRFFQGQFLRNGKVICENHYEEIRRIVPAERLLEFRVEDGWEPLCKLLGDKVPDQAFPNGNTISDSQKGQAIRKSKATRRIVQHAVAPLTLLIVVGIIFRAKFPYRSLESR
ncbi:uncharacterized protein RAG0_05254 [Rhynchosporium agropyri]|uniref:NAD dependent epimerase/dehydratase n=1 Tax=Rhynchosporium agropyri TaxID=914238 RepID=A0A1E1KC92_9HELO|nr:uncharacterized protein RAG0_05254 [Rhynchosporium agropyri]